MQLTQQWQQHAFDEHARPYLETLSETLPVTFERHLQTQLELAHRLQRQLETVPNMPAHQVDALLVAQIGSDDPKLVYTCTLLARAEIAAREEGTVKVKAESDKDARDDEGASRSKSARKARSTDGRYTKQPTRDQQDESQPTGGDAMSPGRSLDLSPLPAIGAQTDGGYCFPARVTATVSVADHSLDAAPSKAVRDATREFQTHLKEYEHLVNKYVKWATEQTTPGMQASLAVLITATKNTLVLGARVHKHLTADHVGKPRTQIVYEQFKKLAADKPVYTQDGFGRAVDALFDAVSTLRVECRRTWGAGDDPWKAVIINEVQVGGIVYDWLTLSRYHGIFTTFLKDQGVNADGTLKGLGRHFESRTSMLTFRTALMNHISMHKLPGNTGAGADAIRALTTQLHKFTHRGQAQGRAITDGKTSKDLKQEANPAAEKAPCPAHFYGGKPCAHTWGKCAWRAAAAAHYQCTYDQLLDKMPELLKDAKAKYPDRDRVCPAHAFGRDTQPKRKCFQCGKTGHVKRDCPERKANGEARVNELSAAFASAAPGLEAAGVPPDKVKSIADCVSSWSTLTMYRTNVTLFDARTNVHETAPRQSEAHVLSALIPRSVLAQSTAKGTQMREYLSECVHGVDMACAHDVNLNRLQVTQQKRWARYGMRPELSLDQVIMDLRGARSTPAEVEQAVHQTILSELHEISTGGSHTELRLKELTSTYASLAPLVDRAVVAAVDSGARTGGVDVEPRVDVYIGADAVHLIRQYAPGPITQSNGNQIGGADVASGEVVEVIGHARADVTLYEIGARNGSEIPLSGRSLSLKNVCVAIMPGTPATFVSDTAIRRARSEHWGMATAGLPSTGVAGGGVHVLRRNAQGELAMQSRPALCWNTDVPSHMGMDAVVLAVDRVHKPNFRPPQVLSLNGAVPSPDPPPLGPTAVNVDARVPGDRGDAEPLTVREITGTASNTIKSLVGHMLQTMPGQAWLAQAPGVTLDSGSAAIDTAARDRGAVALAAQPATDIDSTTTSAIADDAQDFR